MSLTSFVQIISYIICKKSTDFIEVQFSMQLIDSFSNNIEIQIKSYLFSI